MFEKLWKRKETVDKPVDNVDKPVDKIVRKDDEEASRRINAALNINAIESEVRNEVGENTLVSFELIKTLARLVVELEDKLADYDTILSDDASGRLPSNFLRLIINKERKKEGKSPVKLFYIASGQHTDDSVYDAIRKFLEEKKNLGKVLLSTEHIQTGGSVSKIIKIMEDLGIEFDISAVSVKKETPYDAYDQSIASRLYFGSVGERGVDFYRRGGTVKNVSLNPDSPHPVRSELDQEIVNRQRKEMGIVADKLSVLLDSKTTKDASVSEVEEQREAA